MEDNYVLVLKKLIAAAWRRRVLLLAPLLVMLPLTLAAVKLLPKQYVATSLMSMQESDRDNPFARQSGNVDYTLAKRIEGLQAWLKSDYVLSGVLRQFTDTDPQKQASLFNVELDDLRSRFSLSLVGNDFLQFSLRGSKPERLGPMLDAIVTRFLEGQLVPDQSTQTASQVVARHQSARLERIRADIDRLRDERANLLAMARANAAEENGARKEKAKETRTAGLGSAGTEAAAEDVIDTRALRQLERIDKKLLALDSEARSVEQGLEKSSLLMTDVKAENPLGILSAPESIRLIDAPKNPVRPVSSGLKIAFIGLLSALLLGLGLAVLAELSDQRVYSAEQIAELSGAEIFGRLPRSSGSRGKGRAAATG